MNLSSCSDNRIFHNNFLNNTEQVTNSSVNVWDDGYPSGGNYWSDYNGTDANIDDIGDTPYVIDENNTDHYPLMNPCVQSGTVYIRADGSIDPPDAPISTFDDVTYSLTGNIASDAHGIVVLRDSIVVDGSGFSVEGTGLEYYSGICFSEIGNVTIRNTNIRNFHYGIQSNSSSNNSISGNNITTNSVFGIMLISSSSNNTISGNTITNSDYGIYLDSSSNNSISGNNITSRGVGIGLYGSSDHNGINANNVTNNGYYGICLDSSSNNSISGNTITYNSAGILLRFSSNNSVGENTITDNGEGIGLESTISNVISGNNITNNYIFGVELDASSNNTIYHNNFVSNAQQVYVSPNSSANVWDDGYPSGGNYWSDYNGTDANHDGIGDTSYSVDANNTDNYPLMGMFHGYAIVWQEETYVVDIISNSTVSGIGYTVLTTSQFPNFTIIEESFESIFFHVSGEEGTHGFCRINIPVALLNGTYRVTVNGTEVPFTILSCPNTTDSCLYFTYTHPTERVEIIPEFPSFLILPLFFMATLLAVITYRRKHH
jgi:parallel beta-helix repeat protein